MIDKHQLLDSAKNMRKIIFSIENILEGYEGIEGNVNYVKYCYNKAKELHEVNNNLDKMLEDTYAVDMNQRKGINIATLLHLIEKQFKVLDDIDTASDIFKPKWCKITSVVSYLQQLRWTYCTVESTRDEEGSMVVNGEPFSKDKRIVLTLLK